MPDASHLLLFSGAALALLVVPGPAVLYIVARSAAQGRRAGLVSVAGIHTGTVVHIVAAVAGLSAVIAASAAAFTAVKLAGAAYLVWLGIQAWRSPARHSDGRPEVTPVRSTRKLYLDGLVLNVLNPKTAVFFLAFVPQFVDPDRGAASLQLVTLGVLFIVLGVISDGAYALLAAGAGARWRRSPGRGRAGRRLTGSIYIGLGAVTALSGGADT